jgi:hypothetical protein
MKDFIGQEVNVGDYFAYPTIVGRSASMNIYQFRGIVNDKVKAHPINRSYGLKENPYKVFEYNTETKHGYYRDMTPKEREKYDNKCSTLQMFSERAILLKDYKP